MKDTFAQRMARAVRESGKGLQEIADLAGTSKGQVSQWQTEGKVQSEKIKAHVVESICVVLEIRPRWLLYGEPPMRPSDAPVSPVSATETMPDYLRFPLLEGFVAAGEGGYVPDYPEVVQFVEVAEEWARRNIHIPHAAVRVITARGDSMIGDLNDGDVLFVDCRVRGFDTDSVYVLNWQGRPLVKRLQARMDGSVAIRSTNPAYETEVVPRGEVDQIFISGRVIAAWVFKKF